MKNYTLSESLKKFSSIFLTLSLLIQVGILIPLEVGAITKTEFFEESFGNGSSTATVSGWVETEANASYAKISTTNGMSNSNKRHLRLSKGAYVTKTISTVGYTDVELSYYWRGDTQAESSDKLRVFWKKSTDASFTEINVGNPPHDLDTNTASWSNKVVVQLPVEAWDTSIDLMFKGDTSSEDEEARVDEIKLLGLQNNILVGNMDTVCTSAGYDFGVAKYEWKHNGYQKESEKNGYTTTVTGTASQANWTSNPAVVGVISKQATSIIDHSQSGSFGTINKGAHDISFVVLCGNDKPDLPTGTIHITKYECPVGTNLTRNANGPALDGSHTAPEVCDTKSGAYFSYENSNPGTYPGLDGSYLPIPGYSFPEVMGATDANGVLEATVPYLPGKAFNVAETDSDGVVLPSILALYCNGDTDTSKNDNYEQIPSVGEGVTKYCVAYNEKVEEPEEPTATIIASKIICPSEDLLPNWGAGDSTMQQITANTASQFINANPSCYLADWDFQWVLDSESSVNPGDNILAPASSPWTTFSSSASVPAGGKVWVREVLKEGYINFTGQNTTENVSAEIYCHTDILNYDNWDFVENAIEGKTYYCVAFNAPVEKPLICDPNVNLIENGDFETPVVTHNAKWDIFPSGATGLGWLVEWFGGSAIYNYSSATYNRPETALLELHRGVNGWNTSGGEDNLQYAELDSDWFGPDENVQNEPASVAIWQDIPTIPGKTYKLSFDFSPRPSTDASQNVLGVLWGGNPITPSISKIGGANTLWETYTYDLTATDSLTTLKFRDEGTSNSMGTFLDNVSLYCQNEPADPCTYGTQVFYSDENHSVGEGTSVATYTHQNWVSTTSDAIWMWSDAQVQNPTQDKVKVFTKTFNVAGVPTDALLSLASDNSYKVIINGNEIASTTNENNFSSFVDYDVTSALVYGENTIEITVHNWALDGENVDYTQNPAGVIYALYVDTKLCPGDNPHEPNKLQVKIYKYLDGEMATEDNANGYSFPMHSTWSWPSSPQNQGSSGSGDYFLNQNGHGGSGSYSAYTSVMNAPASYSTYEKTTDIDQNSNVLPIGAQCQNGMFRLVGYRVGDTLEDAKNANLQTTNPSLNGLQNDTYIIVENETCPNVSTVTMCKYDESQNPLSGWTLMLLGDLKDSVSVYPDGNNYNSIALEQGNYVLLANGTYVYRPSDPTASTSDAAYSLRLPSDAVYGGPYIPWVRVNDFPLSVQGWLGIQVNESYTDWGSIFNPNHVYAHSTSTSGVLSLRILDDNYGDNSGNLSVDIYEGFAGVTGQNGCVVFENVPYGTYEADEIMKDGWSYLSGKGTVVIDSEDEAISIFNTTDLPELVCKEGESFVEGQCVKDNDEYNGPVVQTLTDDTGGTTPPGGRRRDISGLFSSLGSVLGASTDDEGLMCEPYLKEYIKFGANNNPDEVRKLQIFLNQFFELDNPVTGFYGPITFEMVKKFQAHQEAGTLTPWAVAGIPTDGPTGYVYKTTKRWINILKCPEMLPLTPIPQLP